MWRLIFEVLEHALNFNLPRIFTAKQVCRTEAIQKASGPEFLWKLHGISTEPLGFLMGKKKLIALFKIWILFNCSFWKGKSKANSEANDAKSWLKCYLKTMLKICLEKYHGIWLWREERSRRADWFSRITSSISKHVPSWHKRSQVTVARGLLDEQGDPDGTWT